MLRDLDILTSMAKRRLARVYVSVTTLDAALARRMEPRAATPERRLHAIAELTRAGVPAGVLVAPMIPGLNDAEMEKIVEAAARAGARHAGYVLLRLPHELRQMFEDWLATHFPDRAKHVLNLIRETRAGALSDARFHHRFSGQGVYADLLLRRFARATRQWGLDEAREGLDCGRFAVPDDGDAEGHRRANVVVLRRQAVPSPGAGADLYTSVGEVFQPASGGNVACYTGSANADHREHYRRLIDPGVLTQRRYDAAADQQCD